MPTPLLLEWLYASLDRMPLCFYASLCLYAMNLLPTYANMPTTLPFNSASFFDHHYISALLYLRLHAHAQTASLWSLETYSDSSELTFHNN
jgi:hypothetical protein